MNRGLVAVACAGGLALAVFGASSIPVQQSSAGPAGIPPKYFSTRRLASAGSKSPAITSERLFGV